MFNSIKGKYQGKSASSIFIETHGIEWELHVNTFLLDKFEIGEEVKVYTWMQHREDVMQLFGFADERERVMFLDLMKVEGIGAKQAVKILSNIRPDDLEVALENGDIARLQAISGIGKKTAQKMTLALKGKLTLLDDESCLVSSKVKSEYEEIVNALVEMGYDRRRCVEVAEKVASAMKESGKDPSKYEADFFRLAIVELA